MDKSNLSDYELWNSDIREEEYGPKYKEHIFEQYKLYVEMADQVSNRRNLTNTFFLTLHTLLLGMIGFSIEKGPILVDRWLVLFPLASVVLLCLAWWMIVRSYRQLNTGKYLIVGVLEKKLPASPYFAEWKALGEGKDLHKYLPITHVENWIPLIFAILYIFISIVIYFTP